MAEQSIDVVVRARDLTREAFKQVEASLTELDRKMEGAGGKSKGLGASIKGFYGDNEASFKATGQALGLLVGGVAAVSAGIVALGIRGADVADIRGSFDQMNKTIGNDSVGVLKTLKDSFAGTVSDFDLMKMANVSMSSGLKASKEDFGLLGDAARVLADRTGMDATAAFDTLSKAMATGKTKGAELLIGTIDNVKALKDYEVVIGKASEKMTEQEKVDANALAMKSQLKQMLTESGKAQFDFADAVQASGIMVGNFKDALGEAIATSPVVNAMLASFKSGFEAGFGGDQAGMVKTLTGYVNSFAIGLVDGAQMGLTAAGVLGQAWSGLQLVFSGSLSIVFAVGLAFAEIVATTARVAASIPGVGSAFKGVADSARSAADMIGGMQQSFHDQAAEALEGVKGNSAFQRTLDGVSGSLGTARTAMVAAAKETATAKDTTAAFIPPLAGAEKGLTDVGESATKSAAKIAAWNESVRSTSFPVQHFLSNVLLLAPALESANVSLGAYGLASSNNIQTAYANAESTKANEAELRRLGMSFDFAAHASGKASQEIAAGGSKIAGIFTGLPGVMMAAFTGGGDVGKSIGGSIFGKLFDEKGPLSGVFKKGGDFLGKLAGGGIGKMMGSSLGSMMGPLGTMLGGMAGELIGPLIGKVGGFFKDLFGGPNGIEVEGRKTAASFRDQIASTLTEAQKAEAGTDEWKKSVIGVRDAYIAAGKTEQEALDIMDRLWRAEKKGGDAVKVVIAEINANMGALGNTSASAAAVTERGFDAAASAIADTDRQVKELESTLGDTEAAANSAAAAIAGAASAGGGNNHTDKFRGGGTDSEGRSYDQWLRDYYDDNPSATTNQAAEHWAQNLGDASGSMLRGWGFDTRGWTGFATGTGGQFLDFGAGTPTMLHGRERVVTEAEGMSEAARFARLEALLSQMASTVMTMPALLSAAQRDALLMAGSRR